MRIETERLDIPTIGIFGFIVCNEEKFILNGKLADGHSGFPRKSCLKFFVTLALGVNGQCDGIEQNMVSAVSNQHLNHLEASSLISAIVIGDPWLNESY
jgi:hypothetical protein